MSEELKTAFETMKGRYKPGVIDAATSFYFSLGDSEGQKWHLIARPDGCEIDQGKIEADVVLKTSEELFLKLIRREWIPGAMDFMTGKIKSNDPTKLTILKDCF